jgi:hypothetical protein
VQLSFPLIEKAIGPSGKLIGIEPSPEMLRVAQERVAASGWKNVTFIPASAGDTETTEPADALVIFRFTNSYGPVQHWSICSGWPSRRPGCSS